MTNVVLLIPSPDPIYELHLRHAEAAAPSLGIRAIAVESIGADPAKWEEPFVRLARSGTGLLIVDSPRIWRHRDKVAELAGTHRAPAIYDLPEYVQAGGLLSYGPDATDVFRRTGILVGRVLKGAKPAEIPVEQPTKFDLVVNLKTAKVLGLTVPPSLLTQATQVIE